MSRPLHRLAWTLACWLPACATSQGPAYLTIDSALYEQAFDAAIAASRANDMPPAMRDRRAGLIDTQPTLAGSILEPWRGGNASLDQAAQNTVVFQRRRARFEFTPRSFRTPNVAGEPDLLGLSGPPLDLTTFEGPVELRVSVVVERAYSPGQRRDTWSRRNTTRAVVTRPANNPGVPTTDFWTPVTRDTAFERRLLAQVADLLLPAGKADSDNPQARSGTGRYVHP